MRASGRPFRQPINRGCHVFGRGTARCSFPPSAAASAKETSSTAKADRSLLCRRSSPPVEAAGRRVRRGPWPPLTTWATTTDRGGPGPVSRQLRSRGRATSHTTSPTRTSRNTPMTSNPTKPIPIPEPPIMVSFSFACSLFRVGPSVPYAGCEGDQLEVLHCADPRSSQSALRRGRSFGAGPRRALISPGGPGSRASKQFLALVILLTMKVTLSLAEVKAHFSALVGRINSQHDRVTVHRSSHPHSEGS